ncbi:oligosaccharide flippase family protein [Myroides odoratimimus]|uniref:oligosaccharide flippase family protein n=1 Tax=Myroides odoratimimus TaxID=76832 RepID=UPI003D2F5BFF
MRKDLKELLQNTFYLYLVQGLNYLLPLVTLPYLLLTLSTESFGEYSFSFAFSQFAVLFVDFGFNLSGTKRVAENSDDESFLKVYFWRIVFIKSMFFTIVLAILLVAIQISETLFYYKQGLYASLFMVLGTVFFPVWWFQGMNKMKILSLVNAVSKILIYPLIFLFVVNENDAFLAIIIQGGTMVFAGILSFFYLLIYKKDYFKLENVSLPWLELKNEIKYAWPIFLSNSSISLYTNSLTLLLGFFSTSYYVGVFGAMERIVRVVCFGILGPVNQACFPVIARVKKTDFSKARQIFNYVFFAVISLLSLAYIGYLVFRQYIFSVFMKGYVGMESHLTLFMLTIFPIALGGVCGQLGLLALGDEKLKKIFSKTYIYCGIGSIPLSLFSIYLFNLNGAMFSMMFVELTLFVVMFYHIKLNKFLI